ncbi:TetR family transcriptional regulator [Luteimicrobium album]|uniref:TetR family transcriptional regulator n=1 Tax=Luteimicrobium album TaxID=1054550 RepID=A0ABQ6HWJ8_9MICO|nr:TetR family transcriptional regulator [Luteimicrobium album]
MTQADPDRPRGPGRPGEPAQPPRHTGARGPRKPREPRRQSRGAQRRDAIVRAAAELILSEGPAGVTHRTVAAQADVPLAATTYYFSGLDELVETAGRLLVERWTAHTREVVERDDLPTTAAGKAERIVDAIGPSGDDAAVRGFYEHLVAAGRSAALGRAYAETRNGLDDAVSELLAKLGLDVSPQLIVAIVDGAALTALSEGRSVRPVALQLAQEVVERTERHQRGEW